MNLHKNLLMHLIVEASGISSRDKEYIMKAIGSYQDPEPVKEATDGEMLLSEVPLGMVFRLGKYRFLKTSYRDVSSSIVDCSLPNCVDIRTKHRCAVRTDLLVTPDVDSTIQLEEADDELKAIMDSIGKGE